MFRGVVNHYAEIYLLLFSPLTSEPQSFGTHYAHRWQTNALLAKVMVHRHRREARAIT